MFAASPVVLMLMLEEPLPVPDAGLGVNHAALSLTVQLSVLPPVLEMVSAWLVGFAPPCVAVKPMLVGLNPIVAGAVNIRDTVTV